MKEEIRYSPQPPTDYRLKGTTEDEVTVILGLNDSAQIWNLFWLSSPSLDEVPKAGAKWFKVYHPIDGLLSAVLKDVLYDPKLKSKLSQHPLAFADWFEKQSCRDFRLYRVAGQERWVGNVTTRARAAADRLLMDHPPMQVVDSLLTYRSPT